MNRARELCNKIEARLRVIRGLADILMENDVFKTGAAGDGPAQLEADHELIVHEAVHLLSDQAQDEMIELMDAMEVPV
ncbi:hypothetical protein QN382_19090 [Pseudomonas sp. 10B1]|uniref:hypothetical protein n=1 Tax=unclassified Pseudomonas TaxID=196821 RepID=UPI002B22A86B|nr:MULTISPECIES: hypothetical protein [unclassified Pseudomonas]MEA9994298.1 hypothetical protein [Pseudomonas sp. AA4]MEB0088525.1 hypothetical protein [Pseudomonas sp. RTI1]MEB0126552.1 hypothetical protein [Pseudomonas sp. CCC1.2]MEB0154635.1 hypothetical protein [Pseudomonas sp. CCC4.3]MEB0221148.1 hypothetical protein [Pseudomonas sp. AB12(2023)]